MTEKRPKITTTGAIIILSVSILIAASMIASAIRDSSNSKMDQELEIFNMNFENYIRIIENGN
ncbi:hypothetical protein [Bacillus alkalicellulosilyticus]|uniref:hypothetical protein n=1 Tax=Alkalihalobacterium alkalicellulosilyticum TaxID=1912214 RepID=UPI00099812FA|nr:hypothetical protein [Bacillus alkalicellulosilyticus]